MHPQGDRVPTDALGATDWLRMLITAATAAPPALCSFRHEKDKMADYSFLLLRDCFNSANVDTRCRSGFDQIRDDDDDGHVQRGRGRKAR